MSIDVPRNSNDIRAELNELNSLIMNHETMIELYPEDTALKVAMKQLFDRRDVLIRESKKEFGEEIDMIFEDYCINKVRKCILRFLGDDDDDDDDDEDVVCGACQNKLDHNMIVLPRRNDVEDDEEAWTCWACQNNRNLDRTVTRTYKEGVKMTEEYEENKEMRIFRSRIDDGYMWVNVPASGKGKTLYRRVTLEREIPEGLWSPTENRFIDYADIKPPTQEEMELIEEEIQISEGGAKSRVPTLRIYNNTMASYYYDLDYEENKEMNEGCEEESYRTIKTTWPSECSGCLYRAREYVDEIDDYVECIHPLFSRKSYECPVRMTAMAKKKYGRTKLDDYI